MSELDRREIVLDRHGVAHAVSMRQVRDGVPVRYGTWCGQAIRAGDDASWTGDCHDCESTLKVWRSRMEAEREVAEKRRRATDAMERLIAERKRKR